MTGKDKNAVKQIQHRAIRSLRRALGVVAALVLIWVASRALDQPETMPVFSDGNGGSISTPVDLEDPDIPWTERNQSDGDDGSDADVPADRERESGLERRPELGLEGFDAIGETSQSLIAVDARFVQGSGQSIVSVTTPTETSPARGDDGGAVGDTGTTDLGKRSNPVVATPPATPTATPIPATATPIPATAIPATAIPATPVSTAAVPATAIPATAIPATAVPTPPIPTATPSPAAPSAETVLLTPTTSPAPSAPVAPTATTAVVPVSPTTTSTPAATRSAASAPPPQPTATPPELTATPRATATAEPTATPTATPSALPLSNDGPKYVVAGGVASEGESQEVALGILVQGAGTPEPTEIAELVADTINQITDPDQPISRPTGTPTVQAAVLPTPTPEIFTPRVESCGISSTRFMIQMSRHDTFAESYVLLDRDRNAIMSLMTEHASPHIMPTGRHQMSWTLQSHDIPGDLVQFVAAENPGETVSYPTVCEQVDSSTSGYDTD